MPARYQVPHQEVKSQKLPSAIWLEMLCYASVLTEWADAVGDGLDVVTGFYSTGHYQGRATSHHQVTLC